MSVNGTHFQCYKGLCSWIIGQPKISLCWDFRRLEWRSGQSRWLREANNVRSVRVLVIYSKVCVVPGKQCRIYRVCCNCSGVVVCCSGPWHGELPCGSRRREMDGWMDVI